MTDHRKHQLERDYVTGDQFCLVCAMDTAKNGTTWLNKPCNTVAANERQRNQRVERNFLVRLFTFRGHLNGSKVS